MGYNYILPRSNKKEFKKKLLVLLFVQIMKISHEDHERSPGFHLMPGISEFALINDIVVDINIISPSLNSKALNLYNLLRKIKKHGMACF